MKSKIGIIVAIVLLIIIGVIGYFASSDLTQSIKLRKEVSIISQSDITKDEIDMEIKTKGNYAAVEKTIKEYMNTYSITCKEVLNIMQDKQVAEILSAENYKNDGPDFVKSKEYIETTRINFNEKINKLIDMTSEETMKAAIEYKGLDENFKELYIELMLGEELKGDLQEAKDSLTESSVTINNILDVQEKVINMLIQNKGKWEVEDEQIVFSSQALVNQYNEYINSL